MAVKFLKDTSVARMYDISRSTVWRWSSEGKLPKPVIIANGTTRWRLSDLEELEALRSSNP